MPGRPFYIAPPPVVSASTLYALAINSPFQKRAEGPFSGSLDNVFAPGDTGKYAPQPPSPEPHTAPPVPPPAWPEPKATAHDFMPKVPGYFDPHEHFQAQQHQRTHGMEPLNPGPEVGSVERFLRNQLGGDTGGWLYDNRWPIGAGVGTGLGALALWNLMHQRDDEEKEAAEKLAFFPAAR